MILYLDAGHGGVDPDTCEYTTAPAKMYDHGDEYFFHEGGKFYEGVFNRDVADKVIQKMNRRYGPGNVETVYHKYIDTPLSERTKKANAWYNSGSDGILISIHANAGKGTGFEVFTSKGQTKSDKIAEFIYQEVTHRIPSLKGRPDTSDTDHDKEADFWMLRKTAMPAVLIECGFFDNPDDAKMLIDPDFQDMMAEIIVDAYEDYKTNV